VFSDRRIRIESELKNRFSDEFFSCIAGLYGEGQIAVQYQSVSGSGDADHIGTEVEYSGKLFLRFEKFFLGQFTFGYIKQKTGKDDFVADLLWY